MIPNDVVVPWIQIEWPSGPFIEATAWKKMSSTLDIGTMYDIWSDTGEVFGRCTYAGGKYLFRQDKPDRWMIGESRDIIMIRESAIFI